GTTDDSTPTLRGTGPANNTILLRYFRLVTMFEGTIKVDASGNWTWTAPQLEDGSWTFEVKKQGQSQWSSYELNIDTDADRYPTIESALDNAGPVTGSLSSGSSTADTTPTLRGSGPANSVITLRYKLDGGSYASTTVNVDGSGKWTWTPSALAKGSWTFEVQKAGQSGWSSFTLTVDPTLDMQPTIDDAWDNFGAITGSLKNGDTTDDSTPTLRGRGVAGTIIHIQNSLPGLPWATVGSTVVKADGTWEWTSPALSSSNTWNFQARAQTGDHYSAWSDKFVVEYVAATPGAPNITDAFDNFGAETGSLASGDTTDDQTPTLRGTALANSVVMIRAQHASGEKIYSVKASADGNWSWTPDKALAKGEWDFQVKNSGAESWGQTFELNLDRGPVKSTIIDFERYNAGDVEPLHEYWFGDEFYFGFYDLVGEDKYTRVVDTPDNAPDVLGDKAFIIGDYTRAFIGGQYSGGKFLPYENFKCDIWNGGNTDIRFTFYYQLDYNGNNPREFNILIKAGEIFSLNLHDYIEDKLIQTSIWHIGFNFPYNFRNVYIDNLTIEFSPNAFENLADKVENLVHVLDGVDALTEHAITGIETQVDTLQLTAKDQLLDLSQHKAEIQSVEIFDIRGSGDNTLIIDLDALLHYGEKDLFIEDGKTQLMVNGDAGDVVQLKDILPEGSDISEWQHQQGTVTVAGVEYEVYSHGDDAELLVQLGVKTELI
uniref:Ig-like domain-containing protein n=1 Tax=Pantoea endophytica TaxID=92488 RepID=UPI001AE9A6EF